MKTTKTMKVALLSLMLVLCMMVGLASCNFISSLVCPHQWQDATCTTPKTCTLCAKTEGDALGHSGGTATCSQKAVCSVCNAEYGELGAHTYTEEIAKKETLKTEATCTGAAVYYKSCTCGAISTNAADVFVSGRAGKHQYSGTVCTLCGFDASTCYYFNLVESFVIGDRIALRIQDFVFEVETTDPTPTGMQKVDSVDVAELEIYYENGEFGGAAHAIVNTTYFGSVKQSYELSALIEDGYIYLHLTDRGSQVMMQKYSIEELLEDMFGGSNIDEDVASPILPFVVDVLMPMAEEMIDSNRIEINDLLDRIVNIFFLVEKKADGSVVITLSEDKLLALSETIATKPIAEVVDIYFGADTFDGIVDTAFEILDLKICEIPAYLKDNGIDYDTLIEEIQELLPELGAPEDFDINNEIMNSEISDYTIGELIFQNAEGGEDYKKLIEDNIISTLRNNSVYALAGLEESFKTEVNDVIGQVFDYLDFFVKTNAAGEFDTVHLGVKKFPISSSSMADNSGDKESMTVYSYTNYISFSLDLIADGEINVTWGNIVDKYNASLIPLPDSVKEELNDDMYTSRLGSLTTYFENEKLAFAHEVRVEATIVDLDNVSFLPLIASDCNGWYNYNASIPGKNYTFRVCYNQNLETLLIGYNGQTAKLTATSNGYDAKIENGETKNIIIAKGDKSAEKLAAELLLLIFPDAKGDTRYKYVDFYYNATTGKVEFDSQHNWEYDFDMFGETCYDGYNYTQTCTKCNASVSDFNEYHMYENNEIDLAEKGLCGGYVREQYCLACGEGSCYINDYQCDWYTSEYGENYSIQKCTKCGVQKRTERAQSEKDENCEFAETQTYIYTVNGNEIYRCSYTYTSTQHNFEHHYEMHGASCEDGYTVTEVCSNCGLTSGWENEEFGHERDWNSDSTSIDLNEAYGICGGYIERCNCSICHNQYDEDYGLYYCNFEVIHQDDTSVTEQCTECGVSLVTTYGEYYSVTIYYKGEEIYSRKD